MSRVQETTTTYTTKQFAGQPTSYTTTSQPVYDTVTQVGNQPVTTYVSSGSRVGQPQYVTGTTAQYVTGPTQYVTGQTQYVTGQTQYVTGPTQYVTGSTTSYPAATSGVVGYATQSYAGGHKVAAEEIPVESRIEYIPFEKKYVEYDQVEKVISVPYEREIVDYEEVTHVDRIPIEKTITDYYAVETQVEYIRKEIEETIMVEQPVETIFQRVQYIPVETQIVHYPERDNYVAKQGQVRTEYVGVQGGSRVQTGAASSVYTTQQPVSYTTTQQPVSYTTTTQPVTTYTTNTQPVTTTYAQSGSRVGATGYQTGAVGSTAYQTATYGYPAGSYEYSSYQPAGNVVYTTSPGYTTTEVYETTGSNGVRGQYVTGGSGVRNSNLKNASYDTTTYQY